MSFQFVYDEMLRGYGPVFIFFTDKVRIDTFNVDKLL